MNAVKQTTKQTRITKAEQSLRDKMLKLDNTSKKIRFLHAHNKSVLEIEQIFHDTHVTTKDGHPIRYQHIRNVLVTRLVSDNDNGANDN